MAEGFHDQFLKIQRDISLAMTTGDDTKDHLINHCVHRLKTLYYHNVSAHHNHESGTLYQLALICLEIVWWGDPDLHDNLKAFAQEVFDLCAEMREDAAAEAREAKKGEKGKGKDNSKGGYCEAILEEVLQHLEALTQEALSYLREQTERMRRRPQARKWLDYIRVEALRPHVPPMSGRVEDEPKQLARKGVKFVVFRDDGDGDGEEDAEEAEEDANDGGDDVMDTANDNADDEDIDQEETQPQPAPSRTTTTTTTKTKNRKIIATNTQPRHYPSHFNSQTSPDPRTVIYKRAFARYWAQDPTAWSAMIDRWEEEHGMPGCSRELVEELVVGREMEKEMEMEKEKEREMGW